MKILHYCNSFSPVSETFIYDVITELDEKGISNMVVTRNIVNATERPYRNVICLPVFKTNLLKRGFIKTGQLTGVYNYDWTEARLKHRFDCLHDILNVQQPDVIHAHFGPAGFDVLENATHLNIPLIVSFHGFDAFKLPNDPEGLERMRAVFKGASIITVVSQFMKDHLVHLGCAREKLRVIHVGKKIKDFEFRNNIPEKIRNFISIGRLTDKKGHKDAIAAFEKLSEKYPDISLRIIGGGPLEEELKLSVTQKGLQNNIELLGALSHDMSMQYLEAADAFLLCSKTAEDGDKEGIPTVLMEAQAFGKPCITTRHSGIPEVIPSQSHWMLAEEGNWQDIAAKVETLILSDIHQISTALTLARNKVELEFNLSLEVDKLIALYNDSIVTV